MKSLGEERALELANEWFDSTVAECRRLEAKYGLPVWGEELAMVVDGHPVIREVPFPEEYRRAKAEWDKAREERNVMYERRVKAQRGMA